MTGRGMAQKSLDLIEAMHRILEPIQPATVRGVCYQLFVRGLIKDMGKLSTDRVSRFGTKAREQGLIPWHWIVDEGRETEQAPQWNTLGDYGETVVRLYRKDFWQRQRARLLVISEKATVGGVVRPVLNQFAVGFAVYHGYGSSTKLHELAGESAELFDGERALEILYIGDYDPSGMHMSEVDLPGRLADYGGIAHITRLALTAADCVGLPGFPARDKIADSRYRWFVRNYGDRCWELDAMNPNDLRERLRNAIISRIDMAAWEHCKTVEKAERESLNRFVKRWSKAKGGK
jgi:hypothetical protein